MVSPICLFGDSVARGVIFDTAAGRYRFLKACFASTVEQELQVRVDNFSKYGCTILKGRDLIKKHALELGGYPYTALEFGGNDCDFDWADVSRHPDREHYCRTPLPVFEKTYLEIIDEVSRQGSRPVLFSLPPVDPERYFARISRELNAENILHWLGDVGHIYRWHEMYNSAVCQMAYRLGLPLIDIRKVFLESRNCLQYICEDGIHPNAEGHALIAEVVEGYVKQYGPA